MTSTGFRFPARCTFIALLLTTGFQPSALAQSDIAESCEQIARECPDAVISDINIIHRDIFEASDPLPAWFPRKTVNRLHIDTTEQTIRQNLLFEVG